MTRPNVKPCPFCGRRNMVVNLLPNEGIITCPCGARMRFENTEEFFEHVTGDIYRKIPMKLGMDIVIEHWNRRAGE